MDPGVRSTSRSRLLTAAFLLLFVFTAQLAQMPSAVAQEDAVPGAVDGTPEAQLPPVDEPALPPDDDAQPDQAPTETVSSLVDPVNLTVDSRQDPGVADPCFTIDTSWASVLVRPWRETGWVDPATGSGGGLSLDPNANPPIFGWDALGGGVVWAVIVPDGLDQLAVPANLYDYRPFLGAIASDDGLTAPGGTLSAAYLCVPAPAIPTEPPVSPPSETPIAAGSPGQESRATSPASASSEPVVRPAAIGIGSVVQIAEPLNLRSSPGLTATVIAVLQPGTSATVAGGPQSASGYTWWQLSTPSGTGWSVVDYLIEQPITVTPTSTVSRTPTRTPTRTATSQSNGAIGIGSTVQVRQRLNLRDQPGTSGAVIAIMPVGTQGTVLEGPQGANGYTWWRISTSLGTGWAAGQYLELAPGTAVPTSTPTMTATPSSTSTPTRTSTPGSTSSSIGIGDLVRTTTRLNLRAEPGTQASVITVLPSGSEWPVIGGPAQASGWTWWQLQTGNGAGWVAAQYLTRVGIAPSPTITWTPTLSPTAALTRTPSLTPTMTLTPTITLTPTVTPTLGSCGSFGYGDIVRTTDSVNFRSQPSTSASIIRTLAIGERGTVRGGPDSANGFTWCQIQIGTVSGWVASQYLERVSGPVPTPNGTVTPRPSPPSDRGTGSASVVYGGSTGSGMIALTFDAGADRGQAAYILDVLADYGVHATFGMTGTWARDNPDLVQRMVSEGHQLINHTWSHPSFTGVSSSTTVLTRSGRIDQLDRAEAIVEKETGYQMQPYWRPPYGDIDVSVLRDVYAGGYYVTVMWSCDTLAWNGATEQQILDLCMYPSGAGDIILMHVGADGLDWAALDNMIRYFQGQGLQIVTIETLLGG